mmetsp:Transcript_29398/g.94832  ORF Transcript_29398/g.94832 Transcript_29398/m.94832 type:complete len:217 (+) Transcript_29398:1-651(+)
MRCCCLLLFAPLEKPGVARRALEARGVVALRPRVKDAVAFDRYAAEAIALAEEGAGFPRGDDRRLDVRVEWPELEQLASEHVGAILEDLSATTQGCVVSFPGAPDQSFHADGNQKRFYTVFVPLVDVDTTLGPTQFALGSHRDAHAVARAPTLQYEAGVDLATPELRRGDLLVFSYQVLHRGLRNASPDTPRPIYYAVFAPPGMTDDVNFHDLYQA